MHPESKYEKLFWSIALPGFGQLLNKKFIKGGFLILLEFLINVQGNLNEAIVYSFQGKIEQAIVVVDYGWVMFYPCVYLFAIWDAFRDGGGGKEPYDFLPFVFAAFMSTIGVIYSANIPIFGVLWGPVFLPILCIFIGLMFGFMIKMVILKSISDD